MVHAGLPEHPGWGTGWGRGLCKSACLWHQTPPRLGWWRGLCTGTALVSIRQLLPLILNKSRFCFLHWWNILCYKYIKGSYHILNSIDKNLHLIQNKDSIQLKKSNQGNPVIKSMQNRASKEPHFWCSRYFQWQYSIVYLYCIFMFNIKCNWII